MVDIHHPGSLPGTKAVRPSIGLKWPNLKKRAALFLRVQGDGSAMKPSVTEALGTKEVKPLKDQRSPFQAVPTRKT